MKFSIITPTYRRPKELIRALESVLNNEYENWEMIIVNDSPSFNYSEFEEFLEKNKDKINNRIKYFINEENMGVNFSRNFALKNISEDYDYIVFLDDDDYFNKEALTKVNEKIITLESPEWIVTNRFDTRKNKSITVNNTKKEIINYFWDYLIMKKFSGDVTNFISTKYKNKKFSKVKNSEEWFFFIQLTKEFYYYNFNATFSTGYEEFGMTNTYNKKEKIKNTKILIKESIQKKIFNFKLALYFFLRIFAIILK
jgi:glycosyltransferase involved in cell wall biosynthesis